MAECSQSDISECTDESANNTVDSYDKTTAHIIRLRLQSHADPSWVRLSVSCGNKYVLPHAIRYISSICPEAPRGRICTKFAKAIGVANVITGK